MITVCSTGDKLGILLLNFTAIFTLWLFNAAVGGIWFRLRLWVNGICFYHGPKTRTWVGRGRGFYECTKCTKCTRARADRINAKLDRLEARRKAVTGQ